jgi:uncharacterized membrane protein
LLDLGFFALLCVLLFGERCRVSVLLLQNVVEFGDCGLQALFLSVHFGRFVFH